MSQPWTKGILFKSLTLSDHGADAYTGMIREHNGRIYMLVKANGTIGNGEVVIKDTTSGDHLTVTVGGAVSDRCIGVNISGSNIATLNYAWLLIRGRGHCSPDGTWSDGELVGPSATGGLTIKVAADAIGSVYGVAIKDSSATVNENVILFDFGFGWSSDLTP